MHCNDLMRQLTSRHCFSTEVCVGMGIPMAWDSHGNHTGMGVAFGLQMGMGIITWE